MNLYKTGFKISVLTAFYLITTAIFTFNLKAQSLPAPTEPPAPPVLNGQIITPTKKTEDFVTVQQCNNAGLKIGIIANADPENLKKHNLRCNQIYVLENELTLHQLSVKYQETLIDRFDAYPIDRLRKDGICLEKINDATSQKFNMVNTKEEQTSDCKARLKRQLLNSQVQLREKTTANNKAIKDLITESEKEGVSLGYDNSERKEVNATVLNDFYILISGAKQSNNEVALEANLDTQKAATYDPTIISDNLSIENVKREQVSNQERASQLGLESGVEVEKDEKSKLHEQVKGALEKDKFKLKQSYESDKTRAGNQVLASNTPQGAAMKSELKKGTIQFEVIDGLMKAIEKAKIDKSGTSLSDLNTKNTKKVFLGGSVSVPTATEANTPGEKVLDKEIEETLNKAPTELQ